MGSSTQTAPTPYQPPNQAGAASAFQSGTAALTQGGQNIQATALPGYQQVLDAVTNDPYYAGTQAAANATGAAGTAFGSSQVAAANGLQTLSNSLGQYAPAIAQNAFDPQAALYNRTQTQLTDQSNAINAMNGVAGSPYGAGLAAQNNENFNIDWQNTAQTRELAGITGLEGLASAQSGLTTAATNVGDQGLATMTQAGQLPTSTYLDNQQAIAGALDTLVQGDTASYGLTQQGVQDEGGYLSIGQQAAEGAIQAAQVNNQAAESQMAGFGSLFGDVLGMFSFAV